MGKGDLRFFFEKPEEIPAHVLQQIQNLIIKGGAVGEKYIRDHLRNAFLIAYATAKDRVVGTVTLKQPKEEYRKKIESATGLDLSGYLERGYHSVEPEYRNRDIADTLIRGLIQRSKGMKTYVTISMDNLPPLRLAQKNRMVLAAKFINERTGNEIGVFTNQPGPQKK